MSQVQNVKNNEVKKTSTQIVSPLGQFSYPCLFKPKLNTLANDGSSFYSVDILFDKNTDLSEINNAIETAIEKKFGPDKSKHPKKMKMPIKDGDEKGTPEYKGKFYLTCRADASKGKLMVYNKQRQILESESDLVGGDYGHVLLNIYAYDAKANRGVTCSLQGVMLAKRTEEPFSGRSNAYDAFESLAEDNYEEQNSEMFK